MSHTTPHTTTASHPTTRRALGRRQLRGEELLPVSSKPVPQEEQAPDESAGFPHEISVRINTMLYQVLSNYVESANMGGDYTYVSVADFIREALREHATHGKLEARAEKGTKKRLTLRVDAQVKRHYDSLPRGKRTEILERVVRTKLLLQ